jgi:hypothetical protein
VGAGVVIPLRRTSARPRRIVGAESEAETADAELGVELPVGARADTVKTRRTAAARRHPGEARGGEEAARRRSGTQSLVPEKRAHDFNASAGETRDAFHALNNQFFLALPPYRVPVEDALRVMETLDTRYCLQPILCGSIANRLS